MAVPKTFPRMPPLIYKFLLKKEKKTQKTAGPSPGAVVLSVGVLPFRDSRTSIELPLATLPNTFLKSLLFPPIINLIRQSLNTHDTTLMMVSSFIFGNHHFLTTCDAKIQFSVTFQKFTRESPLSAVINELSAEVTIKDNPRDNRWMMCCIAIQVTGSSTST